MTNPNPKLPSLDAVHADILRILDETGLTPDELTVDKYSKAGGKFDGRRLRRMGGFAHIVDDLFHEEVAKDFNTTQQLAQRRNYVNKLERELGNWQAQKQGFLEAMQRTLKENDPIQVSNLKKPELPAKEPKERANLAFISDIHLGLKIDREEVGTNAYDWRIGARRLGKYAEQVAKYKIDHRDECGELRLCLGGDLGQGVIHTDYGADAITQQCFGISKYLIHMVDYWRHHYDRIVVEFTPDNHMRMPHRGPDRNMQQKWDSFSTFGIALTLQAAFRTMPDVTFHMTKNGITTFNLLGHKFGMTHGDTHINSGSISKGVDTKNIANQILKLNASVTDGKHYAAMLLGHVHTPLYMHLNETNTFLVVNGTGSGTDPYASSAGFFRTKPTQTLMEVTRSYPIGDFRIIDLGDADDEQGYEEIIPVYDRGLNISPSGGITYPYLR